MRYREENYRENRAQRAPVKAIIVSFLVSAVVTVLLLLGMTALVYLTGISGTVSGILMVAIYVLGPFAGAFALGKTVKTKRFLWGLLLGGIYFVCFVFVSLLSVGNRANPELVTPGIKDYIQVMLAVLPGGILGGMLS